ncbi:hypothetical protein BDN70DRAFT_925034 [Pholiota conissans]|uniref:Rhodopsin domain-containing protein n=1 Tax=Pholiota conissans TaxID=109636 RepID=A0A9P5YTL2_9AGAR|nr:hypothetical protein BDN70DRAFT_925034 [Pholiota conissans]
MTVLHVATILTTCLRLEHRRRIRRLWWDDYAVIIPALTQLLNIAVLWIRITHKPASMDRKVMLSYASAFIFSTITWWSRMSLALTVLRIIPSWSKSRPFAIAMVISFAIFWVTLFTAIIGACATHTSWQYSKAEILICGPASKVAIVSTVLDIVGDIGLIAIPLHQLWCIKRHASEWRLVRLVFSSSVLTLVASIALCVVSYGGLITGPGGLIVWIMSCQVAEAVSIITSNLLVLICWFHKQFPGNDERDSIEVGDIHFTPHWSRQTVPRVPTPKVTSVPSTSDFEISEQSTASLA